MTYDLCARISARLARCTGSRAAQEGAVAPFMVLALVGGLLAAGFAIDVLRMTGDAGQLKRATDAAALALGREYIRNSKDFDTVGPTLAGDYVRANLGAGSDLKATLEDVGLTKTVSGGNTILEVAARFTSQPTLSGQAPHAFTIRSAAEVHVGSIEVALVLPFTVDISRASMTVLTNLGKTFASDLMRDDAHVYVSVVPYYQRVNVYDAKKRSRIRSWPRPEGLKPRELTNIGAAPVAADPAADTLEQNFFEQTGIPDLASDKTPDLQTGRLCLLRGLSAGENYFWDQAPRGQFYIGYRNDDPWNAPPGEYPYVTWRWPSLLQYGPEACPDSDGSDLDDRTIIADWACPIVPVLPLTNNRESVLGHLDTMNKNHINDSHGVNINYGFALGWGAMTLAPAFRGDGGWNGDDPALPLDFDTGTKERQKVIVMFVKVRTSGPRFFSDLDASVMYNDCRATTGFEPDNLINRYQGLCRSFREKKIRSILLVTGPSEPTGRQDDAMTKTTPFRKTVGEGLSGCAERSGDISYFNGADFANVGEAMRRRLTEVVDDLRGHGSFVRLIR